MLTCGVLRIGSWHKHHLRVVVEDVGAGSSDVNATEEMDKGRIENGYREADGYLEVGAAAVSFLSQFIRSAIID